jgi:biofilm PGA synthesis N-glycosyltransferase PgaC
LRFHYDHFYAGSILVGAIYPMLYWLVSASAALDQQISSLIRGPRERRVVWDIPRERLDSTRR